MGSFALVAPPLRWGLRRLHVFPSSSSVLPPPLARTARSAIRTHLREQSLVRAIAGTAIMTVVNGCIVAVAHTFLASASGCSIPSCGCLSTRPLLPLRFFLPSLRCLFSVLLRCTWSCDTPIVLVAPALIPRATVDSAHPPRSISHPNSCSSAPSAARARVHQRGSIVHVTTRTADHCFELHRHRLSP